MASHHRRVLRQNLYPWVSAERVSRLAAEETTIDLLAPPFHTVRDLACTNKYWVHPNSLPSEIDSDLARRIGDFGLGSDLPILLNYHEDLEEPCVLRLRWSPDGREFNHRVKMAPDLETFASLPGL